MAPGLVVLKSGVASSRSLALEGPDCASPGVHWDVLGLTGVYWGVVCSAVGVLGCSKQYWGVLGYVGLF